MFAFNKKKCTEEIDGIIIKLRWNGDQWILTVEYDVDGICYTVREQLTYHINKTEKLGKIPIGFHSSSAIRKMEVGTKVRVKYNPNKPKQSYIKDNNGHHIS